MAIDRFTLEFPSMRREADALEFIREFEDEESYPCGTNNLHALLQTSGKIETYAEWLESCKNNRTAELSITGVPTETYFLVRERDERIVGMTTIRLELNDLCWNNGGNIDYCIRKSERGQGYAKINLFLSLKVCYEHDIEAILIDCDQNDLASKCAIRSLDARIIRERWNDFHHTWNRTFVIDVTESVINHFDEYMRKIY